MPAACRISDAVPAPRAMEFRQRVLHVGAAIGEHPIDHDDAYCLLSGRGASGVPHAAAPLGAVALAV